MEAGQEHHAGVFAPQGQNLYCYKRERRDTVWTVLYCVLCTVMFVGGIAAFAKSDKNYDLYNYSFYRNSTTCDATAFQSAYNSLYPAQPLVADDTFVKAFYTAISAWLPITAVVGIAASAGYVLLFRKRAEAMVNVSVICTIAIPGAIGILLLFVGGVPAGIVLLVLTGLLALFFWWIRADLKLCAQLLGVAGRGLQENGWLIPSALAVKTAGVGILAFKFAAFLCALNVGSPGRGWGVASVVKQEEEGPGALVGMCYDSYGTQVPCCTWNVSGWSTAYAVFCWFSMMWTVQLVLQVKLYLVADTIAQWYYMPAGAFSNSPEQPSVRLAARHALTTGFGTASFAAAILVLIRMARSALERASRNNIMCCVLNCIMQPLLQMCEKFTRFATIAAAITGKGFYTAAVDIFDVLKRNFLQTYSLWWIPDMVTATIVALMSLAWFGFVFLITMVSLRKKDDDTQAGASWAAAAVCFALMSFMLAFMGGLLMDIVNTCYICFSMDRDQRTIIRPEIHAIYEALPSLQGAVIEQPDGDVNYGRPDGQTPPPPPANPYTASGGYTTTSIYTAPGGVAMQPLYANQGAYSASPYGAPSVYPYTAVAAPATYPVNPPAYPPAYPVDSQPAAYPSVQSQK